MAGQGDQQAEVWDDSALLDSWNEAFAEYKKYHSLAAKGEKVDLAAERLALPANDHYEIDLDLDAEDAAAEQEAPASIGAGDEDHVNSHKVTVDASAGPASPAPSAVYPSITAQQGTPLKEAMTTKHPTLSIPQTLMASVQNEDMKNLMMSWYYAGYYTGLFEGKQQGYAQAQQNRSAG